MDSLVGGAVVGGIDYDSGNAFALALARQIVGDFPTLGDQCEVIAEDTGEARHLLVGQAGLAQVQRSPGGRTVVLVGNGQHAVDVKTQVAVRALHQGTSCVQVFVLKFSLQAIVFYDI
jgi:hypothetical protein